MSSDYYELLGISRKATTREIVAGFRHAAKQLHPDKCQRKDAAQVFIAIRIAYETLLDPKKRAAYDLHQYGQSAASTDGAINRDKSHSTRRQREQSSSTAHATASQAASREARDKAQRDIDRGWEAFAAKLARMEILCRAGMPLIPTYIAVIWSLLLAGIMIYTSYLEKFGCITFIWMPLAGVIMLGCYRRIQLAHYYLRKRLADLEREMD